MSTTHNTTDSTAQAQAPAADVSLEYRFSGLRLDVRQRRLFNAKGAVINLSSRAFETLLVLLQHHGATLSKAQLMAAVWPNVVVEENNLNQAIYTLRRALGDTRTENNFIRTVPGRGYCFVAPVAVVRRSAAAGSDAAQPAVPTDDAASVVLPVVAAPGKRFPARLLTLVALVLLAGSVWYFFNRDSVPAQQQAVVIPATAMPGQGDAGIIANSIAVLPFTSLDSSSEHELFTVGLHDEVITQLTKVRSLNVIARNSVLTLVDQQLSTADIGRVLRVQSMMSGTILFAGEQARISLQMLDAKTGVTLWTGTYEANKADLTEMISIQSDIAKHVASALETTIQQTEQQQITAVPTTSFEAYRYNLAAKVAHYQQDFGKEWQLAQQAIALDPNYFDALFTFSSVNTVLVATPLADMSSREHFQLALASAERIIEIAPARSEGYALKAVALSTSRDWNGVAAMVDKLEQMQAPASDLKYISLILMCMGNFSKAIAIYEANLVTEPINLYGRGFLMSALEMAGKRDLSRREYGIGEELSPVWWGDTVNIFLALGRNEPLQDVEELVGVSAEVKTLLQHVDDHALVKAGLQSYRASPGKISAEAVYYAALAAHVGEQEQAVEFMRIALDDVWTSLHWVWLPVFDDMRQLESFRQLLRESGIVDHWQQHGWPEVCQPRADSFSCEWRAYPRPG
jgi:TolB-like protein/DNA-binding winged helix-turn-helix (wHTH) protein